MGRSLLAFIIAMFSSLSIGCSVYQSSDRKFLEKQAFQYAGVGAMAQDDLIDCPNGSAGIDETWEMTEQTELAQVWVPRSTPGFEATPADFSRLRVLYQAEDRIMNCYFEFNDQDERTIDQNAAVELTISLGQFANLATSPVQ
jgi:hypothetical protein